MLKTMCVLGTRPEAIKMAPLIKLLSEEQSFNNRVCVTGQHQSMLDSVLSFFNIIPDIRLQVMEAQQNLSQLTSKILLALDQVFLAETPDLVFIHGDTTTALASALCAYYHRIPVAHVEAGLRTGDMMLPWPEEANRKVAGMFSSLHFAPTKQARDNLIEEKVPVSKIHVTGNTVIDALKMTIKKIDNNSTIDLVMSQKFPFLQTKRKMILVTGHRRESFGEGFKRICQGLKLIAINFPDVDIVYPVHLNPQVQQPVKSLLGSLSNIYLIDPLDYLDFVYLMKCSYFILTDSGGVQEEAPALGKPVLVMRDKTERPEALETGIVRLVGTDPMNLFNAASELFTNNYLYKTMSRAESPYGDGNASLHILNQVKKYFFTPLYEINMKEVN